MQDMTIFVNGSWDSPQQAYPFEYATADDSVGIKKSSITVFSNGPCRLRFLLLASVGGERLSWAAPPIAWKDGKAPPDLGSWRCSRLTDDHQVFHLDDPHDDRHDGKSFSFYLQVIDSEGIKRSTDPTVINKPEPVPPW